MEIRDAFGSVRRLLTEMTHFVAAYVAELGTVGLSNESHGGQEYDESNLARLDGTREG
jgi:hypothetical protein